ncbi:hypothetical protein FHR83_001803 [Actinoplanes campanulatus]|uniref:Uncharacterized protein n=1 Tax=Actinoplanes campanulatus TaxID=113559 RepID=A0A7W5FDC5_9ACTN|nr:hypothetical protein [Actinoplanes campanulatus]MBB3094151.1 hypothetical protein [Actinoplanes campanulatus]GGN43400.1 hypothetical protein GCM10010109_75510 [Actinoplanes campanulatus]GID42327.1 hypothetical protein Aca09nite_88330 [Actinoplanes campanulatus]
MAESVPLLDLYARSGALNMPNPRRPDGTENTTHLGPTGAALVGGLVAAPAYAEVYALRDWLL